MQNMQTTKKNREKSTAGEGRREGGRKRRNEGERQREGEGEELGVVQGGGEEKRGDKWAERLGFLHTKLIFACEHRGTKHMNAKPHAC